MRRTALFGLIALTLVSMSGCFYAVDDGYGHHHRRWGRRRAVVVVAP
jgi:hypothetical protein